MTLHITNGDLFAHRLLDIGIDGKILPWREVLHEGPLFDYTTVDTAGRHAFNLNRATFIDARGWGNAQQVVDEMDKRDAVLLDPFWKEILIWAECDLFDQLILAQVATLLVRSERFCFLDVRCTAADKPLTYCTDAELVQVSRTPRLLTHESIAPYLRFWYDVTHCRPMQIIEAEPSALHIARRQWADLQPDEAGYSCFDRRVVELVKDHREVPIDILFQQIRAEDGPSAFWGDTAFAARVAELAKRHPHLRLQERGVQYVD